MYVLKRDGTHQEFDSTKIINATVKAMKDCKLPNETTANISKYIAENITKIYKNTEVGISIEAIQDLVEEELMKLGLASVAKAYILYRHERTMLRNKKWEMTDLQHDIWSQKYEYNKEGFENWLSRVSMGNESIKKLIRNKKFLPAGRILMGLGLHKDGKKVTFSNCYVVTPPEDNLESIFDTAKALARTFSYGGGCGVDIGKLRPNKASVNNAAKTTSGACSFMELYSMVTELIGQSGRRAALMISMPVDHPDIEEFIGIKQDLNKVTKANISIRINDKFMQAVIEDKEFELKFYVKDTGEEIVKVVNAKSLFEKFCYSNWDYAEPGLLNWTRIEDWNLLSNDENFEFAGTNPCAEEPLPAGGSCLLGSLNLSEFVLNPFAEDSYFDFKKYEQAVADAVTYLNNVLDEGLNLHPLQEQIDTVGKWRQIGLGIMGLADMCIKLNIRYGSQESFDISNEIGYLMINKAMQQSALLAKEFGVYDNFNKEKVMSTTFFQTNANQETIDLVSQYGLRNSQILTIAPTGSISTMIGTSGGIEPIYQISYTRKTETLNDGSDTFYKVFTQIARKYMENNNINDESDLPDIFVTAMTLNPMERIKMQSIWQKYIDASISSTINLHKDVSVQEVMNLYIEAWKHGLKGLTIFRDSCKRSGILGNHNSTAKSIDSMSIEDLQDIIYKKSQEVYSSDSSKCPMCKGKMNQSGGCSECEQCGYSPCSV